MEYTAKAAAGANCLERVILSTEDDVIAEAGRGMGLEVPFQRPVELAADDTPMIAVLAHVMEKLDA